jgi:CRISPR-associated protein Cmr1
MGNNEIKANEIKVIFETITPLYTGDAWQESKEIRPSSLIGNLRSWFEVICYFGGICSERDFDKEKGRFEKDIKNDEVKKRLSKYGTDFWGRIEALKELEIPLPAIIFGTTGWKSLIEIESIRYLEDYCFGNKLNLPDKFCISKNERREIKEGNECPNKGSDNNWSVFFFKIPYFWG